MTEPKSSLLIVDDEPLNLDMLSRRLERNGFLVQVAASGSEALRMIADQAFDLVLLDQMMPGMSGAEVLRTLRLELSPEVLPVIMVTAVAESDKVVEALDSGANDYITKPVDFKLALARIRSQLARKRADASLRQSEERYALAARASRDGLWDWDLTSGIMYFSPRWKEMLGLADVTGTSEQAWFSHIVPADRQQVATCVRQHLQGPDDVLHCGYRMRHANGSLRWMSCRGITTRDANGLPVRMAGSQSDVTEEKTRDVLTGLPNRLLLVSQLEFALSSSMSAGSTPRGGYAVLFLDLDGFKTINDSLGHVAGDHLLKGIAARLQLACETRCLEQRDTAAALTARMGGDEFAILLEGDAAQSSSAAFANHLLRMMKSPFDLFGRPVHCVFSIGVALASGSHAKPEDVLREADMAMYTAKVQKGGEIVFFDQSMRDAATEQFELESDLRHAVERNELAVVYQPKVDIDTGTIYGVEALVRWNHPRRGLLQPGVFIPVAEETGVIVDIGRWILRESCLQLREWNQNLPLGGQLELAINLSPREFKQKFVVEEIRATLAETGFPASLLHLEVTESVLFDDIATARATLFALKELGVQLDIDDFGTGYSSLKYLSELPFDSLKIDRYFISNLKHGQPSSGELIRTIINMAANLGLQVVAEGIETESHRSALHALGCRLGQGYLYSKPIGAEAMHRLLVAQRGTVDEAPALPSSSLFAGAFFAAEPA